VDFEPKRAEMASYFVFSLAYKLAEGRDNGRVDSHSCTTYNLRCMTDYSVN